MTTLVVPPEQSGTELLEFLSLQLVNTSKTALRRLIASGRIRLNGLAVTGAGAVSAGDRISLPAELEVSPPPEQTLPIDVLYEDGEHLCINKPAGHPVLPGRKGEAAELYRSLIAVVNRDAPPGGPYRRPHLVHRLDRDTSGVLLVAKTVEAGRALSTQFERRQVAKTYLGIIEGVLPRSELNLDIPLKRMPGGVLKMAPVGDGGKASARGRGKPASTRLKLKERFGHFSLLEIRPLTGRQHQIRVHLAAIGYPLAVDGLYGRRAELTGAEFNAILGQEAARSGALLLTRCPLHAASIRYRHPGSGEPMEHDAPPPDDLRTFLELLRRADPHP